jgi:hypothetical protein
MYNIGVCVAAKNTWRSAGFDMFHFFCNEWRYTCAIELKPSSCRVSTIGRAFRSDFTHNVASKFSSWQARVFPDADTSVLLWGGSMTDWLYG